LEGKHDTVELLEEPIPEGERYTLNSKGLKANRVQEITEALGIYQEILVAERRKMISNKLEDLGYEVEEF